MPRELPDGSAFFVGTVGDGPVSLEQERDNWIETAREFCRNEAYWRERCERAESELALARRYRFPRGEESL